MNVFLLPHHPLDPRFRYTLEREVPDGTRLLTMTMELPPQPVGLLRRQFWRLQYLLRRVRHDYDQMVHGHEQIRLSRLLILMDRDPELTLVIPARMTRESALEAVRAVIRAGQMAQRSDAVRNVSTAVVMMIILFGIIPTHVLAIIFYPLIGLYAWRRYWEDRMTRRIMRRLLEERLRGNGAEHFREEIHLARLEEMFDRSVRPDAAYREAIAYLDGLDHKMDGKSTPEHTLIFNYYRDIGRLDPYERYQDRIRKKLVESAKLAWQHFSGLVRQSWRWGRAGTPLVGFRMPNWIFVVAGACAGLAIVAGAAASLWRTKLDHNHDSIRSAVEQVADPEQHL